MAQFTLPKNTSDITEPVLLPEDWHILRIVKEPILKENNAKTGHNIVLQLRVQSDDPTFNGRPFTMWLPMPKAEDATNIMQSGMTIEDWKIQQITKIVEAFTGTPVEGNEFEMEVGQEAQFFIKTAPSQDGQRLVNEIDRYQDPLPVGGKKLQKKKK